MVGTCDDAFTNTKIKSIYSILYYAVYCKYFGVDMFCDCKNKLICWKHLQLEDTLLWPKPIRLVYWKSFAVTKQSVKATKLFYLEQFAMYNIISCKNTFGVKKGAAK